MSQTKQPIAIITGSNKGIGYELALGLGSKGYKLIITSTNQQRVDETLKKLREKNFQCEGFCLDLIDENSISSFSQWFTERFGQCDVLFNNSGIMTQDQFDEDTAGRVLQVNYFGTKALTEKIKVAENGRILFTASGLGTVTGKWPEEKANQMKEIKSTEEIDQVAHDFIDSISNGTYEKKGFPKSMYAVSKACIIAYARVLAKKAPQTVASFCPGFCKTDLTQGRGHRTATEGAGIWLATENKDKIHGGLFRDESPLTY